MAVGQVGKETSSMTKTKGDQQCRNACILIIDNDYLRQEYTLLQYV